MKVFIVKNIMNTENLKNELDEFLGKKVEPKKESSEEVLITEKSGLVERVEKKFIMSDGRELITEIY